MSFDLLGKAVRRFRLSVVDYTNAPIVIVPAQEGDINSRYFEITLFDDRGDVDLSVYNKAMLNGSTPSGVVLTSKECEISEDGKSVTVSFGGGFTSKPGRVACDILLTNEDKSVALTSQTFYVIVSESQSTKVITENDEEYNELLKLLKEVSKLEEGVNSAENERVKAENERIEAENERIEAENERKSSIVQEKGSGSDKVMSQKAVTYELDQKSDATNLENGTSAGSLKQKDPTYDGLVDALMPYNRSYLKSKGYTSSNPTKAKSILVASGLYSSAEAENYITNNGSEPEVIAEALAKGQLKGHHNIEPDTDLSNTVTEAAASSFVMGIQNKAYSPVMFVGGMNCEAGSKDSSSYLISSFTFGRDLKNYSLDSIMTGLGANSYKIDKNQTDLYKGQQICYLNYLAKAGGQITGEGDNRAAVTGVNDGASCIVLGNYLFSKGNCNILLGNQNIINGDNDTTIGLHNYIINKASLSACIGVQNVIKGDGSYNCYGNFLIGRSLRLEGGKHRIAIGISNAKVDDTSVLFMVGNGDEDESSSETQRRSNAFEVLKDGRAKVYGAPHESIDVVRLSDVDDVISDEMVDSLF